VEKRWKAGFKSKVREALLNMTSPELLASFPRKSFIPASNSDYKLILDVAKLIDLIS
jgi:phosphonate transport system substrate-binding protein